MSAEITDSARRAGLPLAFFGFLTAVSISNIGDSFRSLSLDLWFYEASADKEAARVTLLLMTILPALVLGPLAGAVADRWDLRRTFLVTNVLRGLLSFGLAAAAWLAGPGYVAVLIVTASAISSVFFASSAFVFLPRLVKEGLLSRANGYLESATWAVSSVGPALASGAFALWGAVPAFLIDGVSFMAAAYLFSKVVRKTPGAGTERVPLADRLRVFKEELRELVLGIPPAVRYLAGHRPALGILLGSYGVTITAAVNSFSLIFLIASDLGLPAEVFGFVLSLNGIVAVAAAVLTGVLLRTEALRRYFLACLLLLATSQVIMGLSPNVILLLVGVAVSASVNAPYNVAVTTLFQKSISEKFLGRVEGLDVSVDNALRIVVLLVAAWSVGSFGARPALIVSGVIAVVLCGVAWWLTRETGQPGEPRPAWDDDGDG
ncbi:MFS transporter [Arthrobacter sp.]|uniref:MFS transporter n=1 Tax=Arthrobacter sp. TaxID=1667 RepID=UPI00258D62C7|nr:MFS transporter [Arthrobacter sp.]